MKVTLTSSFLLHIPQLSTFITFLLTSISNLNDIFVDLRLCDSYLGRHLDVLRIVILVFLNEGGLHRMIWGLRGGTRSRAAVGSVGVEAIISGIRAITGASSGSLTAPKKYSLFQIDAEIWVSGIGKFYVTHHCKIISLQQVEKSIFKRWLLTNV